MARKRKELENIIERLALTVGEMGIISVQTFAVISNSTALLNTAVVKTKNQHRRTT